MSELTYEQKIVANNLRAFLQGRNGIALYDEPQAVISSVDQSYLKVTHYRDFPHNSRLRISEGQLLADSDQWYVSFIGL